MLVVMGREGLMELKVNGFMTVFFGCSNRNLFKHLRLEPARWKVYSYCYGKCNWLLIRYC